MRTEKELEEIRKIARAIFIRTATRTRPYDFLDDSEESVQAAICFVDSYDRNFRLHGPALEEVKNRKNTEVKAEDLL